jgi:thioredoxin reductase (NADPH)
MRHRTSGRSAGIDETPDIEGAFPRLNGRQIAELAHYGRRQPACRGDVLFRQGDSQYDLHVVLSGRVATYDAYETDGRRPIAIHGAGRFLGEIGLLEGQAALYTAEVVESGEILVVPPRALREVAPTDLALADLILRAFLVRRALLLELGSGMTIVGSRYSPDSRRLREFAMRNRVPHAWVDLEEDHKGEDLLTQLGVAPVETPVVIWGRQLLRNPSNQQVAEALGLREAAASAPAYDLLIVGAGPAGLAAAVYGASEGLATIIVDSLAVGGQAARTSRIENYLGFPTGIAGSELAERGNVQARKFGARVSVAAEARSLEMEDGHHVVGLDDGSRIGAPAVVIATGARYRTLDIPRLDELEGTSVYYAATWMEAALCRGDPVAVVGGGNSAGQATVFLAQFTPRVTLITRHGALDRDMSRYLADRIERMDNVDVLRNTEVRELVGEDRLDALIVEELPTRDQRRIGARALFVFVGAEPHTGWLGSHVCLDEKGYVLTGPAATGGEDDPLALETSVPGVFAIGDVRHGSVKRVASAVGEGAMAVRYVHAHLARHGHVMPPLDV